MEKRPVPEGIGAGRKAEKQGVQLTVQPGK